MVVPNTSHWIQFEFPEVVVEEVLKNKIQAVKTSMFQLIPCDYVDVYVYENSTNLKHGFNRRKPRHLHSIPMSL
jgi:hypothetical protein